MADDLAELWDYDDDSPIKQPTPLNAGGDEPQTKRAKCAGAAAVLELSDDDSDDLEPTAAGTAANGEDDDDVILVVENGALGRAASGQHATGSGRGVGGGLSGGVAAGLGMTPGSGPGSAQQRKRAMEEMLDPETRAQWERNRAALSRLQEAVAVDDDDDDLPSSSAAAAGAAADGDVHWVPPTSLARFSGGINAGSAGTSGGGGGGLGAGGGGGGVAAGAAAGAGAAEGTGAAAAAAPAEAAAHKVEVRVQCKKGDKRFRIGPAEPLSKLFDGFAAWAAGQGWLPSCGGSAATTTAAAAGLKFFFDGDRLGGGETCESLDLEDGDTIDAQGL